MARRSVCLTEAQWAKIELLFPRLPRSRREGHPSPTGLVIDVIFWALKTGARWRDLPAEYPSLSTCCRRLKRWDEDGTWIRNWRVFIAELDGRGRLQWESAFIDGTFARRKWGSDIAPTKRGKGSKCMVMVERQGIPLGITITSASPAEVNLVDATHCTRVAPHRRNRKHLLGDAAFDSALA